MNRFRIVAVGCGLLTVGVLFVRAQDTADLKAILTKAIEAHGGEKNLAKFKASISKFKGTIDVLNGKREVTGESQFQKPDKFKHVMTLDLNGKSIEIVTVYNGKKLWVNVLGNTMDINDEKTLNATREELQVEGAGGLSDFLKAPYELNPIGEVKIKGKDAVGIRVSKKGQKDFSVFFDKKTHLLLKSEMRIYDANTKEEVTQEKFMVGYVDKNGMKVPKRVEIYKDGKEFMDIDITDVQMLEKLDDATFAKP